MTDDGYLIHYGIKGQHWGVRRFQNEDGSRTQAGLAHDRELYAQQTGKTSSGKSTTDSSSRQKGLTDDQKDTLKAIGKAALIAGGVAAAGYVYARNKDAIDSTISSMSKNIVGNKLPTEIESSGRSFVQSAFDEAQRSSFKRAERRETMENAAKNIMSSVESVKTGAGSVKTGVENATKNAVAKAETVAKTAASKTKDVASKSASNVASRSKVVVKKASKSAGQKLGNAVEDAKDMATGYLVTRTIDKAADRRLQRKQEKNRHQEEMARIRRGG